MLSVALVFEAALALHPTAPHLRVHQRAQRAPSIAATATGGRRAALASGLGIAAAGLVATPAARAVEATPMAYSVLLEEIKEKKVSSAVLSSDGKKATTIFKDGTRHETEILDASDLINKMRAAGITFELAQPETDYIGPLTEIASGILPPLLLLGGLFFLASRGGMGGMGGMGPGGPMQFGKSKSKIQLEPETGVTFKDVAGCDGSKLELTEVVDFLKNPGKYAALGAKVPRGCLMEGPPGTGKTLLAKAVAGEAGVPFISASGSEFVEMFVGVGASRVRDLFGEAKKNAPCIVFIDEIDAVGRARPGGGGGGPSGGGGNDEREQTLNQILTEMDGFDGNSGVIVLAATNRADVLDPALLRAGRFDRRVPVDLPDKDGREKILEVHARGKPLAADVRLADIAVRTTGFSGAQLQNLMNEAAIVAARRNATVISYSEVDYAIDRLTVGMQKSRADDSGAPQVDGEKKKAMVQKLRTMSATQEAGKAVMALVTPGFDTVAKITIIPRANAGGQGGFTLLTPTDERAESGMYSKQYLLNQLTVLLGPRVAEELRFGVDDVTTGSSGELQRVRDISRRMVAQWGFTLSPEVGEKIGLVGWEAPDAQRYGAKSMSPEKEYEIDMEAKYIVDDCYERCTAQLTKHRALMDTVVAALVEKETLNAAELLEMLKAYDPALYESLGKKPPPMNDPAPELTAVASAM